VPLPGSAVLEEPSVAVLATLANLPVAVLVGLAQMVSSPRDAAGWSPVRSLPEPMPDHVPRLLTLGVLQERKVGRDTWVSPTAVTRSAAEDRFGSVERVRRMSPLEIQHLVVGEVHERGVFSGGKWRRATDAELMHAEAKLAHLIMETRAAAPTPTKSAAGPGEPGSAA